MCERAIVDYKKTGLSILQRFNFLRHGLTGLQTPSSRKNLTRDQKDRMFAIRCQRACLCS